MKKFLVLKITSLIMMVIGLSMFSAVLTSWLMKDSVTVIIEMAISASITFLVPLLVFLAIRHKDKGELISFKEGFLIVTLGWVSASVAAAIPFVLVADISWVDSFFETMSGFSTTGASVLNNIEDLPKGLLFWRAMTHWLGGMGIVVLSLAILPVLGVGGQQLFKAEVPGPVSDQLTPRIADSAKILWGVYVLLTGIETVLLRIAGMPWFDSICHSFATLATGGFSTKQASIEYYHTAAGFSGGVYIDAIITVFMFLAGCNFILHLNALRGKPFNYFKDEEFMLYLKIILFAIATMTLFLYFREDSIYAGKGLGYIVQNTSFTTLSVITTTGFCTGDFNLWPQYCRLLLLGIMFIGGCGGSTGGGMKVSRILLLYRYSKNQIHKCFYPHMITNVQLNNNRVDQETNHKVFAFFAIFIGIFVLVAILLTIIEPTMDLESAISASVASLANIGPGLGKVGAWENYAWLQPGTKMLLAFAMLIGRLEVFTVVVLFLPRFWKK